MLLCGWLVLTGYLKFNSNWGFPSHLKVTSHLRRPKKSFLFSFIWQNLSQSFYLAFPKKIKNLKKRPSYFQIELMLRVTVFPTLFHNLSSNRKNLVTALESDSINRYYLLHFVDDSRTQVRHGCHRWHGEKAYVEQWLTFSACLRIPL